MIQIHGDISQELLQEIHIPVIKAFNVHDLSSYEKYHQADIVKGYIFDAQTPGSGKTFDWSYFPIFRTMRSLHFLLVV